MLWCFVPIGGCVGYFICDMMHLIMAAIARIDPFVCLRQPETRGAQGKNQGRTWSRNTRVTQADFETGGLSAVAMYWFLDDGDGFSTTKILYQCGRICVGNNCSVTFLISVQVSALDCNDYFHVCLCVSAGAQICKTCWCAKTASFQPKVTHTHLRA